VATLTITTTAAQDARLVVAFGTRLRLGRDATGPEIKAHLLAYVRSVVIDEEAKAKALSAAASDPPADFVAA
jgi:hypothetical protein